MTRGRGRPRDAAYDLDDAGAELGHQLVGLRPARPVAAPRVRIEAKTSSRVCGSMVSTSAVQPRWASASSTTDDVDRAHRAQVLGDDEVGVEVGERALVEAIEVLAPGRRLDHAVVDLPGVQALGHRAVDTIVRVRASAG